MDCFNDFCLHCDKQTIDGPYCSQACRLADLERSITLTSTPPSPPYTYKFGTASWARTIASSQPSPVMKATGSKRLTPSSSAISIMSVPSSTGSSMALHGHNVMAEQARLELQDYFSSFDTTRAAKRRSSVR